MAWQLAKSTLPLWYRVAFSGTNYSPTLADRIAVQTKDGLAHVVQKIVEVVGNPCAHGWHELSFDSIRLSLCKAMLEIIEQQRAVVGKRPV